MSRYVPKRPSASQEPELRREPHQKRDGGDNRDDAGNDVMSLEAHGRFPDARGCYHGNSAFRIADERDSRFQPCSSGQRVNTLGEPGWD